MTAEQKIEQRELQPKGVFWVGRVENDVEIVSEAHFISHGLNYGKVSEIVKLYLESDGNLKKTVEELNEELSDFEIEEFGIRPDEVVELVDWASRNSVTDRTLIRL